MSIIVPILLKHDHFSVLNNLLTTLKIIYIEQLCIIILALLLRYFLVAIIDH
ncbi:hypothetical protein PALI_a0512 [Pseudoalteromonas aliena SW19]|uniref:Uncharacterized protein n=1 Tax=Pseudoalteromonas aliena SW19 TaxID=1314866 RepID=A0ABR9E1F7_9GAMM|nr:hypothetical protein [Pseudoalteromonas aliena SW19]